MIDSGGLQQAKLVLLGDMGAGKSSLVLRFVKGQFFDYQVPPALEPPHVLSHVCCLVMPRSEQRGAPMLDTEPVTLLSQESTIGAAFLTKTMPEQHVKFEIW